MHIPIQISPDHPEPIYRQITTQLRELIVSGQLAPGSPLPSIRSLAQSLSCSVITTRRVYQELEQEGLLHTRQGLGTFVAEIESDKRQDVRRQTIYDALRKAVETGRRVNSTPEELRLLFEQVLKESFNDTLPGGGNK